MKLLLPLSNADEARSRFRREFRALQRLHHPNIIEVFEWGLRGDRPWFTMELLRGRTLREEVGVLQQMQASERFSRVRKIIAQVTRALAFVHDRGLIHRDITPGNVMVGPEGAVKLMDFGVVKDRNHDLTVEGEVLGTMAYIAPEQITGDNIDQRADLYSLGAVLYLLLTGRRPFQAHTLQGYLDKHLNASPKPPSTHDLLIPADLDGICLRLLSKDPADRYASASHLLHVLGAYSDDREDDRWPPQTVGRNIAKARVRQVLDAVVADQPGGAVLLHGPLGQGKTRMLDLAEVYAKRMGLRFARGRCRHHDRPFGAFVGVYRALVGEQRPQILEDVLGDGDVDRVWERYPVIAAFRELVVSQAPCVLILDDLERADPATIELLEYLIRNTLELAEESVSFVLGYERGASDDSSLYRQLTDLPKLDALGLGPLAASEVEELVLSVLDNTPAALALADRIHAEANGSPAFIADMLRGLIDEGLIVDKEKGQRQRLLLDATEITQSRLPMPASLRQALKDRLGPLSADAIELGRLIATARRRLDLDVLLQISSMDEDTAMEALDDLLDHGIVEETRAGETEQIELTQTRMRDVLLEDIPPEEMRKRHRRMGEILERHHRHQRNTLVEELAWHFEQAELAPKAYAYLVQVANKNLHRSLYEETLVFLDRALKMEPVARPLSLLDDADRRLADVYIARSQAQFALGSWNEAIDDGRRAERLARDLQDDRLLSRVCAELGQQLRNLGQSLEAERMLTDALEHAESAKDPTLKPVPLYQLGGLLWGRGNLGRAEQLWRESLDIAIATDDVRSQGSGYNGLGILAICRGQTMEARRHLEQSARLFEELGMLGPLAITRVNLVELYLSTGILRKALQLSERTVAQSREVLHPHGIALGLAWRAQVLLALGRWEEAHQSATEANRGVQSLGDNPEDTLLTQATLVRIELSLGRPKRALATLQGLLPLLDDHDYEGIAPMVMAWYAQALSDLGRTQEAREVLQRTARPEGRWPHVQVRTDLAWSQAYLQLGDLDACRQVLETTLGIAEANGFRFYQLLCHYTLAEVTEPEAQARHQRVSTALSRSLAANLPKNEADFFLERVRTAR